MRCPLCPLWSSYIESQKLSSTKCKGMEQPSLQRKGVVLVVLLLLDVVEDVVDVVLLTVELLVMVRVTTVVVKVDRVSDVVVTD